MTTFKGFVDKATTTKSNQKKAACSLKDTKSTKNSDFEKLENEGITL